MAAAAAAEAVLFFLHHLAFGLRLSPSVSVPSPRRCARSAAAVALLAVAIAAVLTATHAASAVESRPADALLSEVDELRLRVLHLESLLEENTKTLKSKANNLEENNNLIETMEHDIEILMNRHEGTKKSQSKSYPESNVKALEDEVQLLRKVVRKMNENADSIESLANGADKRVESLSLEVKKMEGIVAEQWIQIRQLEQAFVLTKMMTSTVHQRSRLSETAYKWPGKDLVLKYIRNLHGTFLMGVSHTKSCFSHTYKHCRSFILAMNRPYHEVSRFCKAICSQHIRDVDRPNVFFLGGSISRSCISIPYNQFKIFMLSAQKVHHKVQIFLQDAMRSNSYSRGFATELVTFCLAYFVVISPMWVVWFLYSTRFGSKK